MTWRLGDWVSCPLGWGPVVATRSEGYYVQVRAMDLSINKVQVTWWRADALLALTDKEIASMKRSDAFGWTDNVDHWLAVATEAVKECTTRACVTMFVCRRMAHGMPVSADDARCMAREARIFLKTLFQEIEHGGKKVQGD